MKTSNFFSTTLLSDKDFLTVLTPIGKINLFMQSLFPMIVEKILLKKKNSRGETIKEFDNTNVDSVLETFESL